MSLLPLSIAIGPYDHVRDLTSGQIRAEGIDLIPSNLSVEEIFYRFTHFREWDVSEMSFGKYVSLISQGDDRMVAIPVFPSRSFRQSSLYVRAGSGITDPRQLVGKKVGIPEWAQTASIYSRGYLVETVGLKLSDVQWIQAGVNQPGRREKVKVKIPAGVSYTPMPEHALNDLLLAGEIDAVLSARPPRSLADGSGDVVRVCRNYAEVEKEYFLSTGIFPIMHAIVIRREVFERNRWIAMNLFNAFNEAKDNSVRRALDSTVSSYPVPWVSSLAQQAKEMFGGQLWEYGIEPNRVTIEAFLRFAFEQGVAHRRLTTDDIFPEEVRSSVRV
ncbi:4,5-dihydroxyphthalate decarboxylase OS=Castellaniella defragrans OX=75697 GN=HNR28_000913 PE=4 SV=1 [Castellaniella defragrans]